MIEVEEYEFKEDCQSHFISLMKRFYDKDVNAEMYIDYVRKIINPKNPSFKFIKIKNFIAYDNGGAVGHISAFIDSRLNKEGVPIGIIGFYECIDNEELSSNLIKKATNYLKEKDCETIRAPIDLTIWHPYRFVVDQKENSSFLLEPLTKDYYIDQFKNQGFNIVLEYGSAERTNFNTIIPYTKKDYDLAIEEGFKIRTLTKENFREGILSIYKMVNDIFQDSWSFVNIAKEEYLYIYQDYEQNIDNLSIQIISDKDGKDVGFCSGIIDPINKVIILKTIGVVSEYQNKRVGAALLHYQHKIAQEKGFTREIYALIKLGNIVTKLPYHGIKVIRKYVALEKEITQ